MALPEREAELARRLTSFGLDIQRYTPVLAQSFLAQWPNAADWDSAQARASLIATFAIGETTFLRHPEHFAAMRALIPELQAARKGPGLRAFSAGCASGEEAYSLAATLAAEGALGQVLAWDLNPGAVARALDGSYRPWSLRGVDAAETQGWLEASPCGVRVANHARRKVHFEVGNLCTDPLPGDLDIIFCRNVLLYFRPELASQVIERLAQSLRPSGVLFLGHYDPRPPVSAELSRELASGVTVYRRREAHGDRCITRAPSLRPPAESRPPRARHSLAPCAAPLERLHAQIEQARLTANQRRTQEALDMLFGLVRRAPTNPDLHVLTALVAEEAGDAQLMLQAARKACFLVPDEPAPNYFLSVAFVRAGELRRASIHRRIARTGLKGAPDTSHTLNHSEGLTVGQLRRLLGAVRG